MMKQGPYWMIATEQGFRFTPRRGTYAHKRMVQQQARRKREDEVGWVLVGIIVFFAFAALFHYWLEG
jgi:hypothetical protein